MGSHLYLLLNKSTIKVSNSLNDTITFHSYHMYQTRDEILNLKHQIKPFVYLKVNRRLLMHYFENLVSYEYLLVQRDITVIPKHSN